MVTVCTSRLPKPFAPMLRPGEETAKKLALGTFKDSEPIADRKLESINLIFGDNAAVGDGPAQHIQSR
jgi:hypothetical protein